MTNIDELQDLSESMKFWLVINIHGDCFASMLRGVIKAFGMQKSIMLPHIVAQGFMGTFLTWFFGFYLGYGLDGIWMAKTIVIYSMIACYVFILYRMDWFSMVMIAHKK